MVTIQLFWQLLRVAHLHQSSTTLTGAGGSVIEGGGATSSVSTSAVARKIVVQRPALTNAETARKVVEIP